MARLNIPRLLGQQKFLEGTADARERRAAQHRSGRLRTGVLLVRLLQFCGLRHFLGKLKTDFAVFQFQKRGEGAASF